jgi:Cu+-exporting ATPase
MMEELLWLFAERHSIFLIKTRTKLEFIKALQAEGKNVMMVVTDLMMRVHWRKAISEYLFQRNVNVFSPACDAILMPKSFKTKLFYILKMPLPP